MQTLFHTFIYFWWKMFRISQCEVHLMSRVILLLRCRTFWRRWRRHILLFGQYKSSLSAHVYPTSYYCTHFSQLLFSSIHQIKPFSRPFLYRPGQANSQFSLCQNLGILVIFITFKYGNFSRSKIQGLQNDQNCRFWPPKIAEFDFM